MAKPNWQEWNHTPNVKLYEACALSCDVDPHSMQSTDGGWMAGPGHLHSFKDKSFLSNQQKEEFHLRQRVLRAHVENKESFSSAVIHPANPSVSTVALAEFAAWAASVVKWDNLPPELVALAQQPDTASAPNAGGQALASALKTNPAREAETHASNSGKRGNALHAVIESAKESATNGADLHSVWAALVVMAESSNRPAPILGFVEEEGVKYQMEEGIKFFTKRNLSDRMRRAKVL